MWSSRKNFKNIWIFYNTTKPGHAVDKKKIKIVIKWMSVIQIYKKKQ